MHFIFRFSFMLADCDVIAEALRQPITLIAVAIDAAPLLLRLAPAYAAIFRRRH
jgi:hypothetical protein